MDNKRVGLNIPGLRDGVGREVLILSGLAGLVLAAHGGSLWDGVYYDNHWQRAMFRRPGWAGVTLVHRTSAGDK